MLRDEQIFDLLHRLAKHASLRFCSEEAVGVAAISGVSALIGGLLGGRTGAVVGAAAGSALAHSFFNEEFTSLIQIFREKLDAIQRNELVASVIEILWLIPEFIMGNGDVSVIFKAVLLNNAVKDLLIKLISVTVEKIGCKMLTA